MAFYPVQIPYILDDEFKSYVDYREYPVENLNEYIMCIWEMQSKTSVPSNIRNTILPDGCIDIIFDLTKQLIFFGATEKVAVNMALPTNFHSIGIRMKPGVCKHFFELSTANIVKGESGITILAKEGLELFWQLSTREKQLVFLEMYILKKGALIKDKTWIKLTDRLYDTTDELILENVQVELGYSNKKLYRLFIEHYGIAPKAFLNILRLHKSLIFISELKQANKNLADAAYELLYYDQPHFNREIKKYCGMTPLELISLYKS